MSKEIEITKDMAYFIGVLQGDGCIHKSYKKNGLLLSLSASVTVGLGDYEFAEYIKGVMKKLFRCKVSIYRYSSVARVHLFKRNVVRSIEKYKKIKVPRELLDSILLSYYIRGLFDTDGGCNIHKNSNSGTVDFCNKNAKFVYKIGDLLKERFSIVNSVRKNEKTGYDPTYRLNIHNKMNILRFSDKIGFSHPRKREKLRLLVKKYEKVPDRFIRNSSQDIILRFIGNKEFTTNELSRRLGRHRETIKEHLFKMEKSGLVKKRVEFFNRWGVIDKSSCKRFYWSAK